MVRHVLRLVFLVARAVAAGAIALATEVDVPPVKGDQFVGVAGCKSSGCHGGAGEKRSQYMTWSQQDFHSRAYAILTDARSARIAETLGLSAAQESSRCTVCHSPFQSVAPVRLKPTAHPDEGVSCESCHSAAEPWLRGHTRKDWNYAMRVTAGMRDLRSFYVRANTCVACHQNLDSDILKAGHPELTFELDGQSIAEPKHWHDDPSTGLKAWLVGQAVALREMSWDLSKNEMHDTETTARWKGLAWLLGKVMSNQTDLPVIDQPSATMSPGWYANVQEQSDRLARRAAEHQFSDDVARQLLQVLTALDSEFIASKETSADLLFRRAQRLVLALDRLSVALSRQSPDLTRDRALNQLFDDVRSRADFQPARFAEHLKDFRATIKP